MRSLKQFGTAVVFGKFWPLHVGHLRLISEAAAAAERALVVVDDGCEDVPPPCGPVGFERSSRPRWW
jgi:cytidyltransferase-like protein